MVKEPDHRFLRYLCEIFRKEPDDLFFEKMDPVKKLWWYEGWIHDQELKIETIRSHAILVGSFYNPEAANKMAKKNDPDFISSDEDFDKSTEIVRQDRARQEQTAAELEEMRNSKHRRRRRQVIHG